MTDANAAPPILSDHIEETIRSIKRLHAEHQVRASPQQRAVGRITAVISQPQFVAILALAIVGWIGMNSLAVALSHSAIDAPSNGSKGLWRWCPFS